MVKNICVFTSSSDALDKIYYDEAEKLAGIFIKEGYNLIYGGAKVGMMGRMAKVINKNGGKVIGVIPELIFNHNIGDESVELIVTEDMRTRKAKMSELSDAFIALPGGFGTLEELAEVITLKQLQYHQKPIVIINTVGYYNKLIDFFEVFFENNFAKIDYKKLYYIATNSEDAAEYIKTYQPPEIASKWFKANLNV